MTTPPPPPSSPATRGTPARVSVLIPIYGRLGNLPELVRRLQTQTHPPSEILLIDSSPTGISDPPAGTTYLRNTTDLALSGDYNHGAQHATGDFILLMQQDCLPATDRDLEENLALMAEDHVAVCSAVTLPRENWLDYNFWGQALMARWVGTFRQGISGKFDLVRASAFRELGGYDTATFSFAGEDMDLCLRLAGLGKVEVATTRVLHLHAQSRSTRCRDVFRKHYQLAEGFGALFRKWGFRVRRIPYAGHQSHHLAKYLFLLLPLCLIWPVWLIPALLVLTQFTNPELWRLPSGRKWVFLVLNPALLLVGAFGTLKGFLTGRQRYSVNK